LEVHCAGRGMTRAEVDAIENTMSCEMWGRSLRAVNFYLDLAVQDQIIQNYTAYLSQIMDNIRILASILRNNAILHPRYYSHA
jgi:hypothetical protein